VPAALLVGRQPARALTLLPPANPTIGAGMVTARLAIIDMPIGANFVGT